MTVADRTVDQLLARLAELWCAERCDWTLHYDPAMYGRKKPGVTLMLHWTDEWGYGVLGEMRHGADYVTYDWHFDGDTLHEAFLLAVSWLEELAPWHRCDECDGHGTWRDTPCEACKATGLASENPKQATFDWAVG